MKELLAEFTQQYGEGNYIPNIMVNYFAFRIMVYAGFLLLLIAFLAFIYIVRKKPVEKMKFLNLFPYFLFLPYICNTTGWVLTEMGRQPWVVYGLMKTENAVSTSVSSGMVLTTLIGFTLIYGVLMVADVYLLAKYAKKGAGSDDSGRKTGAAKA
jgi:cytochrome d ubiquinol oxidase subunit I